MSKPKICLVVRRTYNYWKYGTIDTCIIGNRRFNIDTLLQKWSSIFVGNYLEYRKQLVAIADLDRVGNSYDEYLPYYNITIIRKIRYQKNWCIVPVDEDDWIPLSLVDCIREATINDNIKLLLWDNYTLSTNRKSCGVQSIHDVIKLRIIDSNQYALVSPCRGKAILRHNGISLKHIRSGDWMPVSISSLPVKVNSIFSLSLIKYSRNLCDYLSATRNNDSIPEHLPTEFIVKWEALVNLYKQIEIRGNNDLSGNS